MSDDRPDDPADPTPPGGGAPDGVRPDGDRPGEAGEPGEPGEAYLWDATGQPDAEIARLEKLLGTFGHDAPGTTPSAVPWPGGQPPPERRAPALPPPRVLVPLVAGLLVLLTVSTLSVVRHPHGDGRAAPRVASPAGGEGPATGDPDATFAVRRVAGSPRIDAQVLAGEGELTVGGWLETDARSQASVEIADIGRVHVEPRSRLRLVTSGPDQHRLELAHGAIEARVTARPRLFVVDTPAATAVDLGCAYTLEADETGEGRIRVTSGLVSLERPGHAGDAVIVYDGTEAPIRRDTGPGTPHASGASAALVAALAVVDRVGDRERVAAGDEGALAAAVATILSEAEAADTLTLWHLLPRVPLELRREVVATLVALSPLPRMIDEEAVLALSGHELELWRYDIARRRPGPRPQAPTKKTAGPR